MRLGTALRKAGQHPADCEGQISKRPEDTDTLAREKRPDTNSQTGSAITRHAVPLAWADPDMSVERLAAERPVTSAATSARAFMPGRSSRL